MEVEGSALAEAEAEAEASLEGEGLTSGAAVEDADGRGTFEELGVGETDSNKQIQLFSVLQPTDVCLVFMKSFVSVMRLLAR